MTREPAAARRNLRAAVLAGALLCPESQMDDMAAAAGVDPVEFRLRLSDGPPQPARRRGSARGAR